MAEEAVESRALISDTKGRSYIKTPVRLRQFLASSASRKFQYIFLGMVVLSVMFCLLQLPQTHFFSFNLLQASDVHSSVDSYVNDAFVVDTPGCKIPNMPPLSPEVQGFVYDYESLECGDPPPLVESNDTAVFIVREARAAYNATEELSCCYTAMWRFAPNVHVPEWQADMKADDLAPALFDGKLYGNDIRFANECVPFQDSALIEHEFVHVQCSDRGKMLYEDYHAFVPVKVPPLAEDDMHWSDHTLNVLIVGVDAVSRLNFLRTMPRTEALLRETLHATSMLGYNKVEDNTFPNMVPLFTGFSVPDLQRTCWTHNEAHFDACPWIWRRFNQRGYVNAFGEDTAWMGLFYYLKKGFINQPTDYDTRPLLYLGEKRLQRGKGLNAKVCIGQRFQIDVLFSYAAKFVRKMQEHKRKFFGHFWGTSLSHDYLNQPDEADALYSRFVTELINSGVLNHTALIFMSDHGLRYGSILSTYQGHLEERLPVMYLALPEWFRKQYSFAMDNLRSNAHRLVTVFDLHRTLLDFMDVKSLNKRQLQRAAANLQGAYKEGAPPRGVSLFVPIPVVRTCAEAGVPNHYCACQYLKRVPLNDPVVHTVADVVVQNINSQLQGYPECEPLTLKDIHSAWRGEPLAHVNALDAKFREHEYQITLYTQPGLALLSATVRHNLDKGIMQMAGTITRLNAYGTQGWCMSSSKLRLYCFCKEPHPRPWGK